MKAHSITKRDVFPISKFGIDDHIVLDTSMVTTSVRTKSTKYPEIKVITHLTYFIMILVFINRI